MFLNFFDFFTKKIFSLFKGGLSGFSTFSYKMVLFDKLRHDSGLENEKSFIKKTSNFEQNAYFWLDWKGGGWWQRG